MPDLTVFRPGSSVLLGDDPPLIATVTSVSVDCGERVTYRCAWWDGRTLRQEWVDDCMLETRGNTATLALGFRPGPVPAESGGR